MNLFQPRNYDLIYSKLAIETVDSSQALEFGCKMAPNLVQVCL